MADQLFLGIEGGGTRTVALLADGGGQLVKRIESGPANLRLLTDAHLELLAWKVRAWWIWYPALAPAPSFPPWQNYATWFAAW